MASQVVIDITRLVGQYSAGKLPTGIDRVSLAYVAHFGARAGASARAMLRWRGRSGLVSQTVSQDIFALLQRWTPANDRDAMRKLLWRGVLSCLWRGDGDGAFLLHTGHNDAEADALWRNVAWHRLRPVFFVHDLIPLTHPQYCRAGQGPQHALRVKRMLQGAAVIANSHDTLQQLTLYAGQLGQAVPPSCVAMLAVMDQITIKSIANYVLSTSENSLFSSLKSANQDYFVVLGTVEPRKNHALLLALWCNLLTSLPRGRVPHLVVIGQSGWDSQAIEAQLLDTAAWDGCVHWVRQCDDAQMVQWLAGARALLFPSFVEGFGMPLAEALALKTPVIASDLAVFREFAADVPCYVSPHNVQAWQNAVLAYAAPQSPARAAQCQRMLSLQLPTWKQHFAAVDNLLDSLNAGGQGDTVHRLGGPQVKRSNVSPVCAGFSYRKARILKDYLRAMKVPTSGKQFVWGAPAQSMGKKTSGLDEQKDQIELDSLSVVRVEDGFVRSVGLGADLVAPISWVLDTRGLYFDASRPSDLEWLLQHQNYSFAQLARASKLRLQLVSAGLTKYNLRSALWQRPDHNGQVVLVAGQVESDASIRLGAHTVRTNLQLLREVRQRCPQAYIVYKPHPDVAAGLRAGGACGAGGAARRQSEQAEQTWQEVQTLANEVVESADMAQLLGQVDEVHVITSLTGFEALLRGVAVTVYGAPFYAGWGLCTQVNLLQDVQLRRTRRWSTQEAGLDHLVAATLIDYPVYLHPIAKTIMSPEQALQVLQQQRSAVVMGDASMITRWRRHCLAAWAQLRGRY